MQKILFFLFAALVITTSISAQENIFQEPNTPEQTQLPENKQEIWKQPNIYEQIDAGHNAKRIPINNSPIPAPIDGGLVALLAAGALYGRRKFTKVKNPQA